MRSAGIIKLFVVLLALSAANDAYARRKKDAPVEDMGARKYSVEGGLMREKVKPISSDSLRKQVFDTSRPDSLVAQSLDISLAELDSLRGSYAADTLAGKAESGSVAVLGSSQAGEQAADTVSARERRRLERAARLADTTIIRHKNIFNDSIPISRVTAISFVVPGFGQVYNSQAWKLPILYGTVAGGIYLGSKQNKAYKSYKNQYDELLKYGVRDRRVLDPIQNGMIKYNTRRQIFYLGALASYIYFVGDGAVNYPGKLTSVKKATTLSTIFPGAGQIYNGSYWKSAVVMGGIATFAYVIDWNNRGYKRFGEAYKAMINGTPTEFYRNGREPYRAEFYKNLRKDYRRNRDLCIILASGFYVLNIIDAHVDAHLKDWDVSDDLSFNVRPTMFNHFNPRGGNTTILGMDFSITF